MTIQRYDLRPDTPAIPGILAMKESTDGPWVLYFDHKARTRVLEDALRELLRVDDDWHGSVNSEMANARAQARAALEVAPCTKQG